jgi:hypothetical protein
METVVQGMAHPRGRREIAEGHDHILRNRVRRQHAALQHHANARARLVIPRGPMAGEKNSAPCMVLRRTGGEWRVAPFHNTLISNPGASN